MTHSRSASCQVRTTSTPRPLRREHRLLGVDRQVQKDLLDLVRVGEHVRQSGRQRVDDDDVGDALLVGAERQRLAHDLVDVDHRASRLAFARKGEQVADDAGRALRLAENDFQSSPNGRLERRLLRQALGPGEDRGQRVVQLVRDARYRLAERGHLLRLEKLVIDVASLVVELLALAHVPNECLDAQTVAGRLGPAP